MLAETLVFWENMQAEEFILVKNGHVPKSQQPVMGPKLLLRNDYEKKFTNMSIQRHIVKPNLC